MIPSRGLGLIGPNGLVVPACLGVPVCQNVQGVQDGPPAQSDLTDPIDPPVHDLNRPVLLDLLDHRAHHDRRGPTHSSHRPGRADHHVPRVGPAHEALSDWHGPPENLTHAV